MPRDGSSGVTVTCVPETRGLASASRVNWESLSSMTRDQSPTLAALAFRSTTRAQYSFSAMEVSSSVAVTPSVVTLESAPPASPSSPQLRTTARYSDTPIAARLASWPLVIELLRGVAEAR